MTILQLALCSALVAMASTADDTCWYTNPPALCDHTYNVDIVKPIAASEDTLHKQMNWCQDQCVAQDEDADAETPPCKHFTVRLVRGSAMCYLIGTCIKNTLDDCLTDELAPCGGGRGDCEANTGCRALDGSSLGADKIRWVCDHVDNPYDEDKEIPEGTDCTLSCSGWITGDPYGYFDGNGAAVNVLSTCVANSGTGVMEWSPPEVRTPGWTEGDEVINKNRIPALRERNLPLPSDNPADQITCGCGTREMAWNNSVTGDNFINYDPNEMPGTTFICEGGDYLQRQDHQIGKITAFMMMEAMTCRLYCDGYHIATIECINGQWTGEPQLGAWCYYEPVAANDVNTRRDEPTDPPFNVELPLMVGN